MTEDELQAVLSAKASWQDGKGLFDRPYVNPFTSSEAALIEFSGATVIRTDAQGPNAMHLPGLQSPPTSQISPCGGHQGDDGKIVLSGITACPLGSAPADGLYTLPFLTSGAPAGFCQWQLTDASFIYTISYEISTGGWFVTITDLSANAVFENLTGSSLGSPITNRFVVTDCGGVTIVAYGGTATISF